jgi:hypothetical protein
MKASTTSTRSDNCLSQSNPIKKLVVSSYSVRQSIEDLRKQRTCTNRISVHYTLPMYKPRKEKSQKATSLLYDIYPFEHVHCCTSLSTLWSRCWMTGTGTRRRTRWWGTRRRQSPAASPGSGNKTGTRARWRGRGRPVSSVLPPSRQRRRPAPGVRVPPSCAARW